MTVFSRQNLFEELQKPLFWASSAEQLRNAAELIIHEEEEKELTYYKAYQEAAEAAQATMAATGEIASAEIRAVAPNYTPAQLLYAFAFENLLKGLAIANRRELIGRDKLKREICTHDLLKLLDLAGLSLSQQERDVLSALTELGKWAGRYPVALTAEDQSRTLPMGLPAPSLLDWGSQHPIVRRLFGDFAADLENRLGQVRARFGIVVVFPPGQHPSAEQQ
jgi:hypothetical protein